MHLAKAASLPPPKLLTCWVPPETVSRVTFLHSVPMRAFQTGVLQDVISLGVMSEQPRIHWFGALHSVKLDGDWLVCLVLALSSFCS